jgi:hypothetical protein
MLMAKQAQNAGEDVFDALEQVMEYHFRQIPPELTRDKSSINWWISYTGSEENFQPSPP